MRSGFSAHRLFWLLPIGLVALAVGCGGSTVKTPTAATSPDASSGTTPGSGATPGTGTLSVIIKDSPLNATALLVAFSEVSVHMSGGGWVTLPFAEGATSRTCDLTKLQTTQDVLGVGTLAAGHYTQLRLTVASAKIYFTGVSTDACAPTLELSGMEVGTIVDVPSGTLKLNREFDVPDGGATTILIDFDAEKSIHQTGNGKYKMTPVIGVVSVL
jgi:hypothetical protein